MDTIHPHIRKAIIGVYYRVCDDGSLVENT
jgi:hypothetical protein